MSLSGLQVGDAGLQAAFGGFCDRWSWGVRALMQDSNQFAVAGPERREYANAERSVIGAVKDVVVAAVGDPHTSDAQAARGLDAP